MLKKITAANTGVDYDKMDPFKRAAQRAAATTADNAQRFGFSEVNESRGESSYLIETPDSYLAHVEEGLGTKNLVADAMQRLTGKSYYDQIAQDTVAMIVNDMITLGALPVSVAMHLAVGDSKWFDDERRCADLVAGWKRACDLARCVWGGGETPTLKGVVGPKAAVLAGSALGIIKPKSRRILGNVQHGDAIIFIESSGIHANGLSMARKVAEMLTFGYLARLPDGRTFGETLLDPTPIYVPIVEDCLNAGIDIRYAVNITGHGWRKLMRLPQPFAYVINHLPTPLPIFDFLQQHGPIDDREAYGNFNMGAGFALIVPDDDAYKVWEVLDTYGRPRRFGALWAGHVETSDERRVVIRPKGLEYLGSTLGVR